MKITILPSARSDLTAGFAFYEHQQEGLGSYFLESLFSDIDSLLLYGGIHRKIFGYHGSFQRGFPTPSTIYSKERGFRSEPFLIAGAILNA